MRKKTGTTIEELKEASIKAASDLEKAKAKYSQAQKKYQEKLDTHKIEVFDRIDDLSTKGGFTTDDVIKLVESMCEKGITPENVIGSLSDLSTRVDKSEKQTSSEKVE